MDHTTETQGVSFPGRQRLAMPVEPSQPETPASGPSREDDELRPFRVAVADAELEDLKRRVAETRWPSALPGEGWRRGVPLDYLQRLD